MDEIDNIKETLSLKDASNESALVDNLKEFFKDNTSESIVNKHDLAMNFGCNDDDEISVDVSVPGNTNEDETYDSDFEDFTDDTFSAVIADDKDNKQSTTTNKNVIDMVMIDDDSDEYNEE